MPWRLPRSSGRKTFLVPRATSPGSNGATQLEEEEEEKEAEENEDQEGEHDIRPAPLAPFEELH